VNKGLAIALGLGLLHIVWATTAARHFRSGRPGPSWTPLFRPPGSDRFDPPHLSREVAILVLVLLAATLLRLYRLNTDLWIDEVFTLVDSVRLPWGHLLATYTSDNTHLLYSILGKLCTGALGESPAALRLPAVTLGVASIAAAWHLARQLCGPRQALLLAALMAFSYHHLWFSQNARGYTGLLLATILSTDLLLSWLHSGRARQGIAVGAALMLGFGFHLSMVFVAAAQGLVVLWLLGRQRVPLRAWPRALWPFLLGATLSLQLYALALPQLVPFYLHPPISAPPSAEWKQPLWLLNEIFRSFGVGPALGSAGLVLACLLMLAGGIFVLRRWGVATWLFVLPSVLTAGALIGLGRNLWPRFFFNQLAFVLLLVIHPAWRLASLAGARLRWPGGRHLAAAGGILVLALSAATLPRNYRAPKQDFRGALAFARHARAAGDRIAGVSLAGVIYGRYYAPGLPSVATLSDLTRLRAAPGRLWLIYTLGGYLHASQPKLWAALQGGFEEAASFPGTLGDGAMVVLREKQARRPTVRALP